MKGDGLATIHHKYMYNNLLYNEYKKYNTLLDLRSTSASINESLYKNGQITEEKYYKFKICNGTQDRFLVIRSKDKEKELRIIGQNRCGLSYCVRCRKNSAIRLQKKINRVLKTFNSHKLLTVTFKNTSFLSKKDIKIKSAQFSKLCRIFGIKKYIRIFEIKSIGKGYNIHIHSVIDNKFIDVRKLSDELRKITKGESYIVDIRDGSYNSKYMIMYLSKYITKLPVMSSKMEYYQYFTKLKNVRFMYTSVKLNKIKNEEYKYTNDLIYNCDTQDIKNLYSVWCDNYFKESGIVSDGNNK